MPLSSPGLRFIGFYHNEQFTHWRFPGREYMNMPLHCSRATISLSYIVFHSLLPFAPEMFLFISLNFVSALYSQYNIVIHHFSASGFISDMMIIIFEAAVAHRTSLSCFIDFILFISLDTLVYSAYGLALARHIFISLHGNDDIYIARAGMLVSLRWLFSLLYNTKMNTIFINGKNIHYLFYALLLVSLYCWFRLWHAHRRYICLLLMIRRYFSLHFLICSNKMIATRLMSQYRAITRLFYIADIAFDAA